MLAEDRPLANDWELLENGLLLEPDVLFPAVFGDDGVTRVLEGLLILETTELVAEVDNVIDDKIDVVLEEDKDEDELVVEV